MVLAINEGWFSAINSFAGSNVVLDNFMIFSAKYLVYIIPIALIYLWFRKGDENKKFSLFLFSSVVLSIAVSMIIGKIYYHPRPFVLGIGTQLISHTPDSSFPSDHTSAMFGFAIPFLFFKKYKSGTVLVILASLVGFARVFCGVHFPFDIIGGFFVGLASAYTLFVIRIPLDSFFTRIVDFYHTLLKGRGEKA